MHHHPSKSEQHRLFFTWKAWAFKLAGLTLAFILLLEVRTVITQKEAAVSDISPIFRLLLLGIYLLTRDLIWFAQGINALIFPSNNVSKQ